MMAIPNDPIMLMSYLNTQLRDNYSSLEEFCKESGADEKEIKDKLEKAGYRYEPDQNRFVR
ncbi:MAG: DUF4250 domain-containing protein [Eubacterium sp.]|nr:DUF4250 domain-containing protein [Eubacterium sp.]